MVDDFYYSLITEKHRTFDSRTIRITLAPYGFGAIVGLVGLISLVVENIHNPLVWKITAVFGSVVAAAGVISLIWFSFVAEDFFEACYRSALSVPEAMLVATFILCAFYSDWILSALAGSLVGVPSSDNKYLYWVSRIQMEPRLEQADTQPDIFCCQATTVLSHLSLLDCRSANVYWILDIYFYNGHSAT